MDSREAHPGPGLPPSGQRYIIFVNIVLSIEYVVPLVGRYDHTTLVANDMV